MDNYCEERVKIVKNQIILAKRGFQSTLRKLVKDMENEGIADVAITKIIACAKAIEELEKSLKIAIRRLDYFDKKREAETNE